MKDGTDAGKCFDDRACRRLAGANPAKIPPRPLETVNSITGESQTDP
jgi:hypothetical protein